MTLPNYVHLKGTVQAFGGGGDALEDIAPGVDGQALIADSTQIGGVRWGAGGTGNVTGPLASIVGNVPSFGNAFGDLLTDSGVAAATIAMGPGASVPHTLAAFSGADGLTLEDTAILTANVVQGPAAATDNAIARFDLATGKLLQDSAVTVADTVGTMTWPAGGGPVLTAGATGSERKGSFVFDGSGTHAKILTTAALTDSVIVFTVITLGTVAAAQAILCTIDTGVGFTPVSADGTDSSVVNWAIVA
jgi:hypothetical protein